MPLDYKQGEYEGLLILVLYLSLRDGNFLDTEEADDEGKNAVLFTRV